jgi:hypothetical protein
VFIIEKSSNGNDWNPLATINAYGNYNGSTYSFTDPAGINAFYRLKQIDRDTRITYSVILRANCAITTTLLSVYPVPAKDNLNIVIETNKNIETTILLLDGYGRKIREVRQSLQRGVNSLSFDVTGLSSGLYILRTVSNDEILTKKILVAH